MTVFSILFLSLGMLFFFDSLGIIPSSVASERSGISIADKMDNLLQWEEQFGFNGSAIVVKDGEIVLNKGYGFANKESRFRNTPQTIFYIASVSKPITALAVMKLVEKKTIALQDSITKFFQNVPENKKRITLEMLLTHTSGLEHTYSCDTIADRGHAITTILNGTPMVAESGVKYNYSGDNYTLLAAIIEIVTGETFESFVTSAILYPAEINKQVFVGELQKIKEDDMADPVENASYKSLKNIESTWGRKGRAGLVLSVEDLYKLDKALTNHKILQKNILTEVLSPKIKGSTGSNYGYGFTIDKTIRGTKVFGHSGDDDGIGHNVDYLNFPDEKVQIFIASNSGMYYGTSWSSVISSVLQRILFQSNDTYTSNKLFHNKFEKYSSEALEKYEGIYQSGKTEFHVWINNNQQLVLSPIGNEATQIFDFSEAYSEKSMLTKSILEETHSHLYTLLQNSCRSNESFDKLKTTIINFWQSLEKKNGPLERVEILGTASIWSGNYHAEIATWFKLFFKTKTQVYRMEWDGNNKIAGLGGSRIPYPMMFTMKAIEKDEFIGFDVANGRAIAVHFSSEDKNGKKMMEVKIGENRPLISYNSGNVNILPKRSAAELLYRMITTTGIPSAIAEVAAIREHKLDRFDLDEGELNDFGYRLLNNKKFNEAISIFTMVVQTFPESSNGFDSLGEAYMKAGNKEEAIKSYRTSLELDHTNKNASRMIEELENK